jgi:hypothetical protein
MRSPSSSVLLLTVVCASIAFFLYRRSRQSPPPSLSPDLPTLTQAYNAPESTTTRKQKANITYPQEPDYFPFTEAVAGKLRMGVKRMSADEWIEIGPLLPRHLALKKSILKEHRPVVCRSLFLDYMHTRINKYKVWCSTEKESTAVAKREVLDELIDYLPTHFPDIFELKDGCIVLYRFPFIYHLLHLKIRRYTQLRHRRQVEGGRGYRYRSFRNCEFAYPRGHVHIRASMFLNSASFFLSPSPYLTCSATGRLINCSSQQVACVSR